jgi:hypothetical protein
MTKDLLRPKRIAPSSLRRKGKKRKSRLEIYKTEGGFGETSNTRIDPSVFRCDFCSQEQDRA